MQESQSRLIAELEEQIRQYQIAFDWGDIPEATLINATKNIREEINALTTETNAE